MQIMCERKRERKSEREGGREREYDACMELRSV